MSKRARKDNDACIYSQFEGDLWWYPIHEVGYLLIRLSIHKLGFVSKILHDFLYHSSTSPLFEHWQWQ